MLGGTHRTRFFSGKLCGVTQAGDRAHWSTFRDLESLNGRLIEQHRSPIVGESGAQKGKLESLRHATFSSRGSPFASKREGAAYCTAYPMVTAYFLTVRFSSSS